MPALYADPEARFPRAGDFFVCDVGGAGGIGIAAGQVLEGDPLRWAAWTLGGRRKLGGVFPPAWQYEHAGLYLGGRTIVQAEPGGTQLRQVPNFGWTKRVLWSTGAFPDLTEADRRAICGAGRQAAAARGGKGVPYSAADYVEIAAHRLGINTDKLRDSIASSGHMICSQEVDWEYQQAGYKLFDDSRWYGDVTPADLAGVLISRGLELRAA